MGCGAGGLDSKRDVEAEVIYCWGMGGGGISKCLFACGREMAKREEVEGKTRLRHCRPLCRGGEGRGGP